ncbi:MAG TPA: glycosyltransferase [Acidocella sp.]|nr:glycosyltransferase [Acidocella sp.]
MTAPLSVIIPTLNESAHLPSLLRDLTAGCDLISGIVVSDGGSSDDTLALAAQAGARIVTGPPGRGGQFHRGIVAASSPWLLLLHADSTLPPGWADRLRQTLASASVNRAYYGRLRFACADPRARLLECGAALRCAIFRLPYGDQGLLIHRDLLATIGGMPEAPLMEDVLLARKLGRSHLVPMDLTISTDATAYIRNGWYCRAAGNLWRLARFLAGGSAVNLAATYKR